MAGPDEVRCPAIAVGESAHRVGTLFGGNTRGETVAHIHRYGECSTKWRVIERNHRIEVQPARFFRRQRRTYDARGIADDERHLFRRAKAGGDEQVALILAIIVI